LGKTDYPHVGANSYPTVPHKVALAGGTKPVLGLTLNQVAKFDENGEKLLYYPQKALENHAVMPGQAVPVARKGMFTLHESAFDISDWATDAAVGHALCVMGNGKVSGKQSPSAGEKAKSVGIVIATGTRTEAVQGSQLSGNYAVCAIDC
jgi:antitoxin component YwqK of YwqJK toxin-antitoxin module